LLNNQWNRKNCCCWGSRHRLLYEMIEKTLGAPWKKNCTHIQVWNCLLKIVNYIQYKRSLLLKKKIIFKINLCLLENNVWYLYENKVFFHRHINYRFKFFIVFGFGSISFQMLYGFWSFFIWFQCYTVLLNRSHAGAYGHEDKILYKKRSSKEHLIGNDRKVSWWLYFRFFEHQWNLCNEIKKLMNGL
jgi:hypothetical protein